MAGIAARAYTSAEMLVPLRFQTAADEKRDALDLLLECHGRIRNFTGVAIRLAEETAPGPERVAAAEALQRYFTQALPLHVADEDQALMPRLLAAGVVPEVAEALREMRRQHVEIELLLEGLVAYWAALRESPALHAELATTLRADSRRLDTFMRAHLELEEKVIFPSIREALAAGAREELLGEIRAKRR